MYRQCGVFWHCTGNEAYSVIYIYIYIYIYIFLYNIKSKNINQKKIQKYKKSHKNNYIKKKKK